VVEGFLLVGHAPRRSKVRHLNAHRCPQRERDDLSVREYPNQSSVYTVEYEISLGKYQEIVGLDIAVHHAVAAVES
jgi:tRNA A37 threonylcarbamoyladenosine biosynthesis protein TsaE